MRRTQKYPSDMKLPLQLLLPDAKPGKLVQLVLISQTNRNSQIDGIYGRQMNLISTQKRLRLKGGVPLKLNAITVLAG